MKKNKKKSKKNIIIAIILIVVWILLISFISYYNYIYDKYDDINDSNTISNYSDDNIDLVTGNLNDTIETSNLNITLDDVEITDIIEGSYDTLKAPENKEYIKLTLTITNNSLKSIYIFYTDFHFILDNKEIDYTSFNDEISGLKRLSGEIESKSSLKGYIIYEVDKNWETFNINYLDDTNYYHKYNVRFNYLNE